MKRYALMFMALCLALATPSQFVAVMAGRGLPAGVSISDVAFTVDSSNNLDFSYDYTYGNYGYQVIFYQYDPTTETWFQIGYGCDAITDDYEAFSNSSSGFGGGSLDLAASSFSWDTTGATTYCVQVNFYNGTASDLGSLILSENCAFDTQMPQTGSLGTGILDLIPNTPPTVIVCGADPSGEGDLVPMN